MQGDALCNMHPSPASEVQQADRLFLIIQNVCVQNCKQSWLSSMNKKLSYPAYPQRKRASNMALLYGANGISIRNPYGSRV